MIHDLVIDRLAAHSSETGWSLEALRYEDPLLHRIGLIEVVRLAPEARTPFRLRARADEVWILFEGEVQFQWHDFRDDSPTQGENQEHSAADPTRVLMPFGVGFGGEAGSAGARLLRVAAEDEGPDDQELDWPSSG